MNAQELAAAIMGAKASKSGNEAKTGKYVYGVENIRVKLALRPDLAEEK